MMMSVWSYRAKYSRFLQVLSTPLVQLCLANDRNKQEHPQRYAGEELNHPAYEGHIRPMFPIHCLMDQVDWLEV